ARSSTNPERRYPSRTCPQSSCGCWNGRPAARTCWCATCAASREGGQAGHGGSAPERSVTVTIGEPALVGTRIRLRARQLDQASLELQAPGVLSTDVGLRMQVFPADSGLPAPAAACAPDPGGPLFRALEGGRGSSFATRAVASSRRKPSLCATIPPAAA